MNTVSSEVRWLVTFRVFASVFLPEGEGGLATWRCENLGRVSVRQEVADVLSLRPVVVVAWSSLHAGGARGKASVSLHGGARLLQKLLEPIMKKDKEKVFFC